MYRIETERLVLTPCTLEIAAIAPVDLAAASRLLGAHMDEEWMTLSLATYLPDYVERLRLHPNHQCWGIWLVVLKSAHVMIGDMGYKGPPNHNGEVDLGYRILSPYRRQGYAYEGVSALLDWTLAQSGVAAVTATCMPENVASSSLLGKLGLRNTGTNADFLLTWRRDKSSTIG